MVLPLITDGHLDGDSKAPVHRILVFSHLSMKVMNITLVRKPGILSTGAVPVMNIQLEVMNTVLISSLLVRYHTCTRTRCISAALMKIVTTCGAQHQMISPMLPKISSILTAHITFLLKLTPTNTKITPNHDACFLLPITESHSTAVLQ